MEWLDSSEYLNELDHFLSPLRDSVCWNGCWCAHTDIHHFHPLIDILSQYTSLADKRVLDSGCGTAGLLLALRGKGASELVGVELDSNIFSLAKLRTRGISEIRIFSDHDRVAELYNGSFDIVISNHVIEHVDDVCDYVCSLKRLLAPDGLLWIACPNRLWLYEAHSQLPLIHYIPRPISKILGATIEAASFLPIAVRDKARTSKLYETDFTYFRLRRILQEHRLEILELNDSRHLSSQLPRNLHWLHALPRLVQKHAAKILPNELRAVCRRCPS